MCGIAGIINPRSSIQQLKESLALMLEALKHRGPEDEGIYLEQGVGLGHRRLSIIDIRGGHQPLANEDGTINLVTNGEIYNYQELRKDLITKGHIFKTKSDSEVILHLYEEESENCVKHLEGMFAFALWDARNKKLLLARDRFGIKPLYIAISKDLICFASELTAIMQSGLIKTKVDPKALYSYLTFSYVPGPLSILKGIKKVQPAERFVVQSGAVRSDIYWTPQEVTVSSKRSLAVNELAGRLDECVRSHLVSDVPVAAFLSGGIDSSSVVAMAQKHTTMETFCASFVHTGIDEAPIARRVADHLGTLHHEVNIKIDPVSLLTDAVNYMYEPFADSSALPTFELCREARKVAKVVLSGDGGDEVFGGYTGRYRVAALKAAVPMPGILARGLRFLPPWRSGGRSSLPQMLDLATLPDEERYVIERQITSASDRAALFGPRQALEYEQALREIASKPIAKITHKHPVHRALWMDLTTSLTDDMLTKVDCMSMAHGLEVRVPFLDHHLVEFALSLPPNWLVSPLPVEGKRLLRHAVAPWLPDGILDRPKQGFVVPLNDWLKNYFLSTFDTLCLGSSSYLPGLLDREAVLKLRQKSLGNTPRHDLYALIILELWLARIWSN
jgi:asparagine synthase (glutamine-hydrolysing)